MTYAVSIQQCGLAMKGRPLQTRCLSQQTLLYDRTSCLLGPQVKEVSENPLANNRGGKFARDALDPGEETSAMETRILEASITKICSLLAVGFGDAGAEVQAFAPLAWHYHTRENFIQVICTD